MVEFWKKLSRRQLSLQHCRRCSRIWHPPSDVCPACQSFDFDWVQSAGLGTLYSFTVVHHAVHPLVESWVPYALCLVDLDEGPRVLAAGEEKRNDFRIGERMTLTFRQMSSDFSLPVFHLLRNSGVP